MVVLNIFHVLIAIAMVALVLVQRGAGATAGAAFGSGASGTVFGARGAGTFLTKSTWVLAGLFCAISLTMAVMVSRMDASVDEHLGVVSAPAAPESGVNGAEGSEQGDLPALQIIEEDPAVQREQATDDLPALDTRGSESTESNQGEAAPGTGSDGS